VIRKTLSATKLATFSVDLPNARLKGMPSPTGTGFFVSSDGWFVTAAHVITENNQSDGPVRKDISQAFLMKESPPGNPPVMCQAVTFDFVDPATDFALLKVDFKANTPKACWQGRTGFPFIEVSSRNLDEGEPVYSFGYPLSSSGLLVNDPAVKVGHTAHSPRTTSAIVASTLENTKMVSSTADPKVYVLDKALNYGNSGGPIVAAETGKAHAFCSRFQPVSIRQPHLGIIWVDIPSLYGIVSSLNNARIIETLRSRGISISDA